ncbi:hypothetical protein SDC9_189435 [bioreactor metagenome]|uniref:DUF1524 domain-containing protein n=1 Tax=bioreactor metagenome TaxID=1076179 RepID=A0A645HSQ6_9ZZZZ
MEKLRENENFDISTFKCEVPLAFFTDNQFNVNTVNTKTFITMLASCSPISFISGANVDLAVTLKQSSSKEFHHIFPDKYLQQHGKIRKDIYPLANFCFLNNADNQKIKDKSPDDYVNLINATSIPRILDAALCPQDTFRISYEDFIKSRAQILLDYTTRLIS